MKRVKNAKRTGKTTAPMSEEEDRLAIINLYLRRNELYSLERLMDGYVDADCPNGLFDRIMDANDEFYSEWEKAEKIFGSHDEVSKCLTLFDKQFGEA